MKGTAVFMGTNGPTITHKDKRTNIPTEELEKKLPSMKTDKPIIYVCGTGARSGEAYYMTMDKRPDIVEVYYVDGEMSWDKDGGYKLDPPK